MGFFFAAGGWDDDEMRRERTRGQVLVDEAFANAEANPAVRKIGVRYQTSDRISGHLRTTTTRTYSHLSPKRIGYFQLGPRSMVQEPFLVCFIFQEPVDLFRFGQCSGRFSLVDSSFVVLMKQVVLLIPPDGEISFPGRSVAHV